MRILVVLIAIAGCSQRSTTKPPAPIASSPPTPAAPAGEQAPRGLLENLHMIATGRAIAPAVLADWHRKLGANEAKLDDFIDHVVRDPEFARTVAPRIMLRTAMRVGNTKLSLRLKKTNVDGKTVYHLRKPCELAQAVAVKPWWTDGTVLVCPDSYQPDREVVPKTDWYCGGANTNPLLTPSGSTCGCGKELMLCYPDELYAAGLEAMQQEASNTIAYVVEKDLPIEQVFLQNETVRSGLADHHYEVWDVMNKKRDHHRPPVKETRLAPRPEYFPGMHAGILTTPHFLFMPDAQRPRINRYSYLLFCNPMKSAAVHTNVVLDLHAGDTRNGEGWQSLVKLPGCTNCHARLDYGVRFFTGWLDVRKSIGFHLKSVVNEEGHLYINDITDLRGKAPTTPHAFATLAVQQPEFARCQAQNVLDYVIGSDATSTMRDALVATGSPKLQLRAMMRVALRAYAARYVAVTTSPATAVAASPTPADAAAEVVVPPGLKAKLHETCTDCHDGSRRDLPSFEHDRLPRKLLQAAVAKVSFGAMPPDGFDETARDAFLAAMVPIAWPASAPETFAFFQNHMRSLLVHHAGTVRTVVGTQPGDGEKLPELSIEQRHAQLTPSFTAQMLLEQLRACKESVKAGKHASVRACMDAVPIQSMIRSPR